MDTKEDNKLQKQVQFWSVLGPFIVLLTLLIILIKTAPGYIQIPLIALFGMPLCLKWNMKGLLSALMFLAIALGFTYSSIPMEDRVWHVGMMLALALAFIVTVLSSAEVKQIIQTVQNEAHSRLQYLWRLDEKLKTSRELWNLERQKFEEKNDDQQRHLNHIQNENLQLQESLTIAAKKLHAAEAQYALELHQHQKQMERNEEELLRIKDSLLIQEAAVNAMKIQISDNEILTQKLHETIANLKTEKSLLDNDIETLNSELRILKQIEQVKNQEIEESIAVIQTLKTTLNHKEDEVRCAKEVVNRQEFELIAFNKMFDEYKNSLKQLETEELFLKNEIRQLQKNHSDHAAIIESLQQSFYSLQTDRDNLYIEKQALENEKTSLKIENEALQSTIHQSTLVANGSREEELAKRRAEAMYLQLHEQFEEKSNVLSHTRRELFFTKEKVTVLQREKEELLKIDNISYGPALERYVCRLARVFEWEEREYLEEILSLESLITKLVDEKNKN